MQISAQALFSAIKEDPKQAKALIKSASIPDITAAKSTQIAQQSLQSANKALDNLFSRVTNGTISKSEAVKLVQNSSIFKSDTPSTSDLKQIVALAQKEPKLSKFLSPIKDFLKDVSTSNADNLKSQVSKSGIGLEAKLNAQATPSKLPENIKTILNDFASLDELKSLPAKDKVLNLIKNITTSKDVFKQDLNELKSAINEFAKNLKLPNQDTQKLLATFDKIEEILQKNPKTQLSTKQESINQIIKDLNTQLSTIQKQLPNLPKQSLELLQNIIKDIQVLSKSIEQTPISSDEKQILQTIFGTQNSTINIQANTQTAQNTANLTTNDKLKMLSAKLKQSIELIDKQSLHVNKSINSGKEVLKELNRTILPSKTSAQSNPITQDIKNSLSHIKELTSSQNTSNTKEIHNLATKTLTTIEANQLISYANNSISTYMPYIWDGLSEGNVSFKQGKDESFFCQIDLEFKVYGRVNMMLMLTNDSYISMSISTEKESLSEKIKKSLPELKKALNSAGLIALHVKMKPFDDSKKYDDNWGDFSMNLKV